jgi:hypothetical protein
MTVINWNPLVNTKFGLEGEYSLKDGYVQELKFDSGKERIWLKNSFIPRVFPSIQLVLNNKVTVSSGKTEFEEFTNWFNNSLRYGILPFQITRLGYKRRNEYIKTDEIGIYKFTPNSVKYDSLDGYVFADFGLEEINVIPEVEYVFLGANDGQILFADSNTAIVI